MLLLVLPVMRRLAKAERKREDRPLTLGRFASGRHRPAGVGSLSMIDLFVDETIMKSIGL